MITKTVYVAVDGKQFDDDKDCTRYETELSVANQAIEQFMGTVRPEGDTFVQHPPYTRERVKEFCGQQGAHVVGSPYYRLYLLLGNLDTLDREYSLPMSTGGFSVHQCRCIAVHTPTPELDAWVNDKLATISSELGRSVGRGA